MIIVIYQTYTRTPSQGRGGSWTPRITSKELLLDTPNRGAQVNLYHSGQDQNHPVLSGSFQPFSLTPGRDGSKPCRFHPWARPNGCETLSLTQEFRPPGRFGNIDQKDRATRGSPYSHSNPFDVHFLHALRRSSSASANSWDLVRKSFFRSWAASRSGFWNISTSFSEVS